MKNGGNMVYCHDCKWYEHGAGITNGRAVEYFVCGFTHRAIWKSSLMLDLECKSFEPRVILREGCCGSCDSCEDMGTCPDVGY